MIILTFYIKTLNTTSQNLFSFFSCLRIPNALDFLVHFGQSSQHPLGKLKVFIRLLLYPNQLLTLGGNPIEINGRQSNFPHLFLDGPHLSDDFFLNNWECTCSLTMFVICWRKFACSLLSSSSRY